MMPLHQNLLMFGMFCKIVFMNSYETELVGASYLDTVCVIVCGLMWDQFEVMGSFYTVCL